MDCGDPGVVENAVRVGSSFLYSDQVTYTCIDGYFQSSGAVGGVRTCQDTGLWSDTQPECTCKNNMYLYSLSSTTNPIPLPAQANQTSEPLKLGA